MSAWLNLQLSYDIQLYNDLPDVSANRAILESKPPTNEPGAKTPVSTNWPPERFEPAHTPTRLKKCEFCFRQATGAIDKHD